MSVKIMSMVYAAHFHDITFTRTARRKTGEVYERSIRVLNSNLKSVCVALADHANDEGEGSYPSVDTLESKTELSNVTVIACLKAMKNEGIISYVGRSKWNTGNYTVNKAKLEEMARWERQKRPVIKSENEAASLSENEAASLSNVKPLHKRSEAASHKPSIHQETFKGDENLSFITTLYEENIGLVYNTHLADELREYSSFPREWLERAFKEAADANARNWRYVRRCLDNWRASGKIKSKKDPSPAPRSTMPTYDENGRVIYA